MPSEINLGLLLLVSFLFPACSTVGSPKLTNYSDVGVLEYSNALLDSWDTTKTDFFGYSAAVSAAGLSSGTLFATAGGSPVAPGLAFGSLMLQWVRSIFAPSDHANALDEGAEMIRDAVKRYFTDKTAAGISKMPVDCMTSFAGVLMGDINDAQNVVSKLDRKRRPKDPAPPDQAARGAAQANTCGR